MQQVQIANEIRMREVIVKRRIRQAESGIVFFFLKINDINSSKTMHMGEYGRMFRENSRVVTDETVKKYPEAFEIRR